MKQAAFGLTVAGHGPVKIQVVLGQVGKDPRPEPQPRRPVQRQGVGGDLHDHMAAPRRSHSGQQLLKLIGIRRGALGGNRLGPHQIPVGADEAHLGPADPFQHLLEQVCGGGLSVGPGDPHQGHPVAGAAKPVGGHLSKGPPGLRRDQPRAGAVRRRSAQNGRCAPVQGLRNEPAAVFLGPRKGRKEAAGDHRSAVTGQGGHIHLLADPICQGNAL